MYFKRLGWPLIISLLSIVLVSCAGEDDPYFEPSDVQFKGAGCLADTFSNFDQFIEGNLKNQEVAEFWDCVSTALVTIERRVVGSGQNGNFKSTELRGFIGTYFLKSEEPGGIVITNELLDEVMEVKRQFLGGSRLLLTREELATTKELVKEFKYLSIKINPYIRTLFWDDSSKKPGQKKISAAVTRFSEVLDRLGFLINRQNNAYEFSRFITLLEEIDKIFDKKDKELPDWVQYIPTFQKVKSLFLNSSEDRIDDGEWMSLAKVLGQGMSVFFRAKYYFSSETMYSLSTVPEFSLMYSSVDTIIREALDRRKDQGDNPVFSNDDFNGIIESLGEKDLLGDFLSAEDIKKLWSVLVDKVLTPDTRVEDGLAAKELDEAYNIFNNWYHTQRWLLGEPKEDDLVAEMKEVLDTPWPYRTDSEGRLIFDDNKTLVPNIESTTQLNWERAAFDLVLRGYIEDPEERRTRRGLTKEELDIAFADIKPIFVQLGLIDADDDGFANSAYFQSSLFMPRSNGDFIFDFIEMIEYAHFVLAGIEMGGKFLDAMPPDCVINEETGDVDYQCWRVSFRELFADRYSNMPFMVDFMTNLPDKNFYKVMDGLESSTRDKGASKEIIKRSEIYEVGIFMQYIETLMFRFDHDRNLQLDISEGLEAVPLFTPQLKELVGIDSDKEVKIILTFMMKYGKPPNPSNPLSLLRYLHWRWTESKWKIKTDRWKIIQILSSLSDFL